ncbi:LysR substrate-binding domain-containing protein (plasmid) [Enterobacter asburiae]|uniref:LysR family transcriptional regulator n=1 Tax=Enterobacter asburiae TaxID=61645 RepID=UPI0034E8ADB4|nr:LysR family transcriptional regulator [Enterobacter asburiae]HDJ1437583.1 LysR family transcriptional regulator [Enterobacter asburiae]
MRARLPLNALRAFETSARYLNFTKAGLELHVSQAAVSQQVRTLELMLGVALFKRVPRGLQLTDEGLHLLPSIKEALQMMSSAMDRFHEGKVKEVITISVVGTFAIGWFLPRVTHFLTENPWIDIRIFTHNNVINLATEGIDASIRFGSGSWNNTENTLLFQSPHTILCSLETSRKLSIPADLKNICLLRSYRNDEWNKWFKAAGVDPWQINGPVFDSTRHMIDAVRLGEYAALAPHHMFQKELNERSVVKPFEIYATIGGYWLTLQKSRSNHASEALYLFKKWIIESSRDFCLNLDIC